MRLCVLGLLGLLAAPALAADSKISLLIVDGMNHHDWPRATKILSGVLESSGRFRVEVSTSPDAPQKAWDRWQPDFAKYDVVLSNFNGGHKPTSLHWPDKVEKALEQYVKLGSGLVIYHSANNSFPNWPAYNKMIGPGWETFHRTADNDKNLPSWIPSTVHYARWGWGTLEPEKGKIDDNFLDGVLEETRQAGQKLAFRAMCCSSSPRRPYHPAWLRDIGGKVVVTRYGDGPEREVPVLDDPPVLAAHLDFIKRLGSRYDGHPDIDHVDLGSIGWWGEWHMSQSSNAPMPTPETQKKIVDAYLAAFQKTPLVMLIGGGEMLKYAVDNGAGWRADCLGDMGGFSKTWCHMRLAVSR